MRAESPLAALRAVLIGSLVSASAFAHASSTAANESLVFFRDAPAVWLERRSEVGFLDPRDPDRGYREHITGRLVLLRAEGAELGTFRIPLRADQRLTELTARSYYLKEGQPSKVSPPVELHEVAYEPWFEPHHLHPEARIAQFRVPAAFAGRVLDVDYVIETTSLWYLSPWSFQLEVPVKVSELLLELPEGWHLDFRHLVEGQPTTGVITPTVTPSSGGWSMRFVRRDVAPLAHLPMALTNEQRREQLIWRVDRGPNHWRRDDWEAIAAMYRSRVQGLAKLSARVGPWNPELVQILSDAPHADRVLAPLAWVGKQIRITESDAPLGGVSARSATEVLTHGEGSSADAATLLVGIYRELGMEAHPVLTSAPPSHSILRDFPVASLFNRVLVAVAEAEGRYSFVDPSTGELPWYLEGALGLLVKSDGSELVTLASRRSEPGGESITWSVEGNAVGLSWVARGHAADAWRSVVSAEDPALLKRLCERYPMLRGADIRVASYVSNEHGVQFTADVSNAYVVRTVGSHDVVQLAGLFPAWESMEGERPPNATIVLGAVGTYETTVRVIAPKGRVVESPRDGRLDTRVGSYEFRAQRLPDALEVTQRYVRKVSTCPGNEVEQVRRLHQLAARDARQGWLLRHEGRP